MSGMIIAGATTAVSAMVLFGLGMAIMSQVDEAAQCDALPAPSGQSYYAIRPDADWQRIKTNSFYVEGDITDGTRADANKHVFGTLLEYYQCPLVAADAYSECLDDVSNMALGLYYPYDRDGGPLTDPPKSLLDSIGYDALTSCYDDGVYINGSTIDTCDNLQYWTDLDFCYFGEPLRGGTNFEIFGYPTEPFCLEGGNTLPTRADLVMPHSVHTTSWRDVCLDTFEQQATSYSLLAIIVIAIVAVIMLLLLRMVF